MDLYDPYMVPHTIPWGYYNFPRSTNNIPFFDEIFTSWKICQFNEELKIWTPRYFFLVGGGSKSILGTGTENQIFILRPPATIKFFHEILKKWWGRTHSVDMRPNALLYAMWFKTACWLQILGCCQCGVLAGVHGMCVRAVNPPPDNDSLYHNYVFTQKKSTFTFWKYKLLCT